MRLSVEFRAPADSPLGWPAIFVPVLGGLLIGLMAHYGSERIRGHGIPEALKAILIGSSRMQPCVAVLKPLSSAISTRKIEGILTRSDLLKPRARQHDEEVRRERFLDASV